MAVAFDTSVTGTYLTGVTSGTLTYTAAAGAYVLVFTGCHSDQWPTAMTYNGVSMGLLASGGNSNGGASSIYAINGVPGGAQTIGITLNVAADTSIAALSFTGVNSHIVQASVNAASGVPSQSVTLTAGQMVAQGFGVQYPTTPYTPTGGTNTAARADADSGLVVNYASSTTTFSMASQTFAWSGQAVILSPVITTPSNLFFQTF